MLTGSGFFVEQLTAAAIAADMTTSKQPANHER
jgi:hypothetical protein